MADFASAQNNPVVIVQPPVPSTFLKTPKLPAEVGNPKIILSQFSFMKKIF